MKLFDHRCFKQINFVQSLWDQEPIASSEPGDVLDVSQMLTATGEDADKISVFNFVQTYVDPNNNNKVTSII